MEVTPPHMIERQLLKQILLSHLMRNQGYRLREQKIQLTKIKDKEKTTI